MAKKGTRIVLKSYDHKLLDLHTQRIVESLQKSNAVIQGPIPLPTRKEVFTILRSPHVNKTSREQFERRTHKRLIIISEMGPTTMATLTNSKLPSGILIDIKI